MVSSISLNESLIAQLCEHQPESIAWYTPVFSPTPGGSLQIIDFELRYGNATLSKRRNKTKEQLIGMRVLRDEQHETELRDLKFEQCLHVYRTGEALEHTYFSAYYDKYFLVSRVKMGDGVLVTARDYTRQYFAEKEVQHLSRRHEERANRFNDILNKAADGIIALRSIRDSQGIVTDFLITQCNEAGFRLGRLPKNAIGKTLVTLLPGIMEDGSFEKLINVLHTGATHSEDLTFTLDEQQVWYTITLSKMEDGLVVTLSDITRNHALMHEVEKQSHVINAILENIPSGIMLLHAVRNEEGDVTDFHIKKWNRNAVLFTHMDETLFSSLSYGALTKHYGVTGNFEVCVKVLQQSQPVTLEYFAPRVNRWFECTYLKSDEEEVMIKFIDINERKLNQLELIETNDLLKTVFDASLFRMTVLKAVRDEEGSVADLVYEYMNKPVLQGSTLSTNDFYASTYLTLFPDAKQVGVWDKIQYVLQTGKSLRYEQHYKGFGGLDDWFDVSVARIDNDRILVCTNNITATKKSQITVNRT